MTEPASVVSDGNVRVFWVLSIADQDEPTLLELNDPTALDITCYLTDQGWNPNLTEDAATDNRLCSTQNYQTPGRKTVSIPMIYTSNPDVPAEDEAALELTEGAVGWLVDRRGVPFEQAWAVGDIVTVYKVKLGAQSDVQPTANTPLYVMQSAYLRPPGRSWRVPVIAS